jgi:hypothetical protein
MKKPTTPTTKSRSGTPWTPEDRAANGDLLAQVRFSGRPYADGTPSDADQMRALTSADEKPAAALRRLVRETYARTSKKQA